uniref:Uncharacterized protein n=1 Tax=Anguilla anguilla TaxID=7936 RepID=A0A0E9R963_ANGAN
MLVKSRSFPTIPCVQLPCPQKGCVTACDSAFHFQQIHHLLKIGIWYWWSSRCCNSV